MANPRRNRRGSGLGTGRNPLLRNPPPVAPTTVRSGCRCWSRAELRLQAQGQLHLVQPYGLELEDDQVLGCLRVWYLHLGVPGQLRTLALQQLAGQGLQLYLHGATPEQLALDLTTLERLVFPLGGGMATKKRLTTIARQVKAMQGIL